MSDRKYENRNGGLWHREGSYMVPADEPLMTLRAKDPDSIPAICVYIQTCLDEYRVSGSDEALAHATGAAETLKEFMDFQAKNPGRVRRGCHKPDTCLSVGGK